jgi:dihydroorotate dehydrogenase electron transfer subunit
LSKLRAGQVLGRDDPSMPVKATCEVLARRRQGSYWLLSISAPEIAERAEPGQFIDIAVEAAGTLLRRPFSIARVSKQGPFAGTVDVVFDAHGPGTEWLTTVESHDVLDVVGPLGNPFPLPKRKVSCLLVGGGYGTAPLFFLADRLVREGLRVDLIVGAASKDRLLDVIEAKRASASVTFTTEDGSYGERGRVTDVLEDVATRCGTGWSTPAARTRCSGPSASGASSSSSRCRSRSRSGWPAASACASPASSRSGTRTVACA